MKTLEEFTGDIKKIYSTHTVISIKLLRGLEMILDKENKTVEIKSPNRLYFGMPQHTIEAIYEGDNVSEFPNDPYVQVSIGNYLFSVKFSQIDDYKIYENVDPILLGLIIDKKEFQ